MEGWNLLLRSTRVWMDGELRPALLKVRDGCIVEILDHAAVPPQNQPVLDLAEQWVLPGMVDTQVHFREPGFPEKEDLESGSRAAVAGGMTAFLEMPNTRPLTVDAQSLADKVSRARLRSWCDFGFFMGATEANADGLEDLERLPGCCGVKIFMGSSTGSLLLADDAGLRRALASGRSRVAVHAEDEAQLKADKAAHPEADHPRFHPLLRSPESARRAVLRLLSASEATQRAVHILHMTSTQEMDLLKELDPSVLGQRVTTELTPQHLLLSAPACYEDLGTRAQMNPPIREEAHRLALWEAFSQRRITVLGSDHAPHTRQEKAGNYPATPSGMPGTETMLPLMLDQVLKGTLPLASIVSALAEEPARIFGMKGKGRIAPGQRADFTVVDPRAHWTVDEARLQSRCGWSPFHGRHLQGQVTHTIVRGRVLYAQGQFLGEAIGQALEFAHA